MSYVGEVITNLIWDCCREATWGHINSIERRKCSKIRKANIVIAPTCLIISIAFPVLKAYLGNTAIACDATPLAMIISTTCGVVYTMMRPPKCHQCLRFSLPAGIRYIPCCYYYFAQYYIYIYTMISYYFFYLKYIYQLYTTIANVMCLVRVISILA